MTADAPSPPAAHMKFPRMPLIYISGPYTGDGPAATAENVRNAAKIAGDCWKKGWAVICPHTNTGGLPRNTTDWEGWLAGGLSILERVDTVLMIPRWETSRGAHLEMERAMMKDIPVYFYRLDGIPEPHLGKCSSWGGPV